MINIVDLNEVKNFQFFGDIIIKASPPIYIYILVFDKAVKLIAGGSVINGAHPV